MLRCIKVMNEYAKSHFNSGRTEHASCYNQAIVEIRFDFNTKVCAYTKDCEFKKEFNNFRLCEKRDDVRCRYDAYTAHDIIVGNGVCVK